MTYQMEYESIVNEFVDIKDKETFNYVVSLDEAGQDQLLTSLTGKLYDKIVEKVDKIDFGTIPASRGDITQIENYESMLECLHIIRDIVKQYGQSTEPIDQIETAINNIKDRERLFSRCYTMDVEMGIIIYNTMVLSVVSSISYMIASAISFIATPADNNFQVSLDKVAFNKAINSALFNDLRKFNIACKKNEVNKALEMLLSSRGAKAATGALNADKIKKGVGITIGALIFTRSVLIPLSKSLLPLIQNMVYIHYAAQQNVSDYFAVQADLLQTNTAQIEYRSDLTPEQKKKIIEKQGKVAERMRKLSNVFQIKMKTAEVGADKLAKSEYKKFKKDELIDTSDSLF